MRRGVQRKPGSGPPRGTACHNRRCRPAVPFPREDGDLGYRTLGDFSLRGPGGTFAILLTLSVGEPNWNVSAAVSLTRGSGSRPRGTAPGFGICNAPERCRLGGRVTRLLRSAGFQRRARAATHPSGERFGHPRSSGSRSVPIQPPPVGGSPQDQRRSPPMDSTMWTAILIRSCTWWTWRQLPTGRSQTQTI